MMSKIEGITLRCTAAFVLNGEIVKPGELVELTRAEAANLLHRGRVEPIGEGEAVAEQAEAPAPVARGKRGRKPSANTTTIGAEAAAEAGEAGDGDGAE